MSIHPETPKSKFWVGVVVGIWIMVIAVMGALALRPDAIQEGGEHTPEPNMVVSPETPDTYAFVDSASGTAHNPNSTKFPPFEYKVALADAEVARTGAAIVRAVDEGLKPNRLNFNSGVPDVKVWRYAVRNDLGFSNPAHDGKMSTVPTPVLPSSPSVEPGQLRQSSWTNYLGNSERFCLEETRGEVVGRFNDCNGILEQGKQADDVLGWHTAIWKQGQDGPIAYSRAVLHAGQEGGWMVHYLISVHPDITSLTVSIGGEEA